MIPIQIARQSSSGKARYTNGSQLINWFLQAVPTGSKTPAILVGTPGTYLWGQIGVAPILAGMMMGGVLYVVTAGKLYSVSALGAESEIGNVTLTAPVSIATNGTYLVFTGANGNGYHYSSGGGLVQFAGAEWLDFTRVKFLDGYFIFTAVAGSDIYAISGINAVTLNAADISYAESLPDTIRAHEILNAEVWLFGAESIEVHYNSADADFPFERRYGVRIEKGIAAPETLAKDGTLFWLADDRSFYFASGYSPERFSTHDVEDSIAVGEISDAHAYIYTEAGHKFYVVTFPTLEITWAFDLVTGLWAERNHSQLGRHYGYAFFRAYDHNMITDYQTGNIYVMTQEAATDNGDAIVRDMIAPVIHANRDSVTMSMFEVKMNSGNANPTGAGSDPEAQLRWSDDGKNTWSNWHKRAIGQIGRYKNRIRWPRLGRFRERHMHLRIAEPVKNMVIDGLYADIN